MIIKDKENFNNMINQTQIDEHVFTGWKLAKPKSLCADELFKQGVRDSFARQPLQQADSEAYTCGYRIAQVELAELAEMVVA